MTKQSACAALLSAVKCTSAQVFHLWFHVLICCHYLTMRSPLSSIVLHVSSSSCLTFSSFSICISSVSSLALVFINVANLFEIIVRLPDYINICDFYIIYCKLVD